MSTLKDRLIEARKRAGLSQGELAAAAGVTQGLISKIERGDLDRTAYIVEIAAPLKVSAEWLMTGN